MNRGDALTLVTTVAAGWEADPATDVVWSGVYEGRPGIRMAQRCRDFTTVWFAVGDRTVRFEAYLLPSPPHRRQAAFRLCLARNWASWPATLAIDGDGDLHVVGHIPLSDLDIESLDRAVGAVYEMVERSFRPLLRIGFGRSAAPG